MTQLTYILVGALVLASLGHFMFQESESDIPRSVQKAKWEDWKAQFMKTYSSEEEELLRFSYFIENLKMIESHNKKSGQTYTLGLNGFADMNEAEFKAKYFSGKWNKEEIKNQRAAAKHPKLSEFKLPKQQQKNVSNKSLSQSQSVNWTKEPNIVGPVNDQGYCGSCWAFSAVEAIQSALALGNQGLHQLSQEQLVQCSFPQGNQGCNGGWPSWGFDYVLSYPLATAEQYPYTSYGGSTGQCNHSKEAQGSYKISGYQDIEENDGAEGCVNLQNALLKQPVSVCVDAENWPYLYAGGIFQNCGNNIDHAVLLVGSTPQYWLIQNSWGTSWGEEGYIRLAPGNTCAVCEVASVPFA